MRMRRILAFVLAVVMLMGNTVTASATSASSTPISGNYNITTGENGETIISPIDVEDEDEISEEGQEVTPPADNGGEPNGGDVGTGDEGSDDDGTGDDTTTPNGDENNNDDINSGEEGGDIDEPNGEDGEGDVEDPEAPAEDEEITTEEETTEEETTEELLAPGPLFDNEGNVEGDMNQNAGEFVSMVVNWDRNNTRYFKSIASAIEWIDNNGDSNSQTQYGLDMVLDTESVAGGFTVSGNDLVSTTNKNIFLSLSNTYNYPLTIMAAETVNENGGKVEIKTAKSNISINSGTVEVEEGVSLQLVEGSNGYWNNVTLDFQGEDTGDLLIGDSNAAPVNKIASFSNSSITNVSNIYVYALIQANFSNRLTADNIFIKVPETVKGMSASLKFDEMEVGTIELQRGFLTVDNLVVTGSMTATGDASLGIDGNVIINNLTTISAKEQGNNFFFQMFDHYEGGYEKENLDSQAHLTLKGALNVNKPLHVERFMLPDYNYYNYASSDVLLSVELGDDEEANASLINPNNYYAYIPNTAWYLEAVKTEVDNLYDLTIFEDYNQIRAYANTDEDNEIEWQKGFEDFASLNDYISENGIEGAKYYVHANEDGLTVSGNDLNFSEANIGGISLELRGHSIEVVDDAVISVEHISGYVYDNNGNRVNGITSDINLPNEGTTLELIPSFTTEHGNNNIGGQGFRIISNNSIVKIGDSNDLWNSEAWFEADVVNELAELHTYGRVSWEGASQVVARKLYAENLSEENMWQEAYIKNAAIGQMHAENGNVGFDKVSVTDTLYIRGGQTFAVKKGGAATIKNVEAIATDDPYSSATIELERQVKLAADDDWKWPSFEGATDVAKLGTVKITGDINVSCGYGQRMATPIFVRKVTGWIGPIFDGDGNPIIDEESGEQYIDWNARTEEFKAGETIATVTNTSIPADMFGIEGSNCYVQRVGTALKAAKAVLRVRYEDYEDPENIWIEKLYTSFADAVKNMPTDFSSTEGRYIFNLLEDTKLTADITIPDFVEELIFETDIYGHYGFYNDLGEWVSDENSRFQKFLDLNGKKLSTSAGIRMNGGVRIKSGVSTAGKLVSTNSECALEIREEHILIVERGPINPANPLDRAPALYNVAVTTTQGGVELWSEDGRDNSLKASFDTRGFFVRGGRWLIEDKSATSKNYVKTTDFSVDGREEGENYLSVSQLTLTNGYGELYGGMKVGTLTLSDSGFNMYSWLEADTVSVTNGNCRVAENGSLITKDLTLNNSVFAEGWHTEVTNKLTMTNSSRLDVWCDMHAKEISAAASKILVGPEGGGSLHTDKITVSTAYAGDALGDYTLQNNGHILVRDSLSMTAGTLENAGLIEADEITVKDLNNSSFWCPDEEGGHDQFGHILCNTITNSGKAYLSGESLLLINSSGTLNNVNVGDRYGSGGEALVGRSQDATVTFKGTFTRNNEDQQLLGFVVTDEYLLDEEGNSKIGNYIVKGEGDGQYKEYQWDWINLNNDNGTPDDWEDDYDADHVIALGLNDLLFSTEITSFPVDAIRVLPWRVLDDPSTPESEDNLRRDNINNSVYQSGKELRITGEFIEVSVRTAGGESHLKNFTKWSDAVAYIDSLNNAAATYVISVRADMDVNGKLTLPTKAAEVVIQSANWYRVLDEYDVPVFDMYGGEVWKAEPVRISFQGDITQSSNLDFNSVILEPYTVSNEKTLAYASTIDTKGKRLNLDNVAIQKRVTDASGMVTGYVDGSLKAIKGTSATQFDIQNGTKLVVDTKISGLNEVYIANGASLEVTGGISVNNLVTVNWPEWTELNPEQSGVIPVTIKGTSSVLEVKTRLNMYSPTRVECEGSMKLADVYTNCPGNVLHTNTAGKITISGAVLVANDGPEHENPWDQKIVVKEEGGYRYATEGENLEGKETAEVMPFAVALSANNTDAGVALATAQKVSPIWFVVADNSEDEDIVFKDFTHKVGSNICSGAVDTKPVVLYAMLGESNAEMLNSFATLQEAFTEIDKLSAPDVSFRITINGDVEVPVSKGKNVDFTFPSKANTITIASVMPNEEERRYTINYNKNLTIKSNVVFEDIILSPAVSGGSVSLGNFTLQLDNSRFADTPNKANITGSGIAKDSQLIVSNCSELPVNGNISNIGTLTLRNATVYVMGSTNVGTLDLGLNQEEYDYCNENLDEFLYEGDTFVGYGAITVKDIVSNSVGEDFINNAIATVPTVKRNAEGLITSLTSTLKITGNMSGFAFVVLADNNSDRLPMEDFAEIVGTSGIQIADAKYVGTESIGFANAIKEEYNGTLYKKSGKLVYKSGEPQVYLEYEDVTGEYVFTACETFADAVKEIDNIKTKRDYFIYFDNVDMQSITPAALTMPKAANVDTLYLMRGDEDEAAIYYTGNITFNSNVVLSNLHFIQVAKDSEGIYAPVDIVKANDGTYASPVSVKVNGAYDLTITKNVRFNTPINLTGAKKATLNLNAEEASLYAAPDNFNDSIVYPAESADAKTFVLGSIKDFATVNVDAHGQNMYVGGYPSGTTASTKYNPTEIGAANMNIDGSTYVYVGNGIVKTDKVAVTNLNINNGLLMSYGTMSLTNVTLAGDEAEVWAYGETFNITGTLTSATNAAKLVTGLKKNASALNISGKVVLENADEHKIEVQVVHPDSDFIEIKLGETEVTYADDEKEVITNKLLTAKNAYADMFVADSACVDGNTPYAKGEDGYILQKVGNDILVYYGDEIGAALYMGNEEAPYNYYISVNDAVAAINALKDKNVEYKIEVLKDMGGWNDSTSKNTYLKLSMPSYASKVTFYSDVTGEGTVPKALYYNNDLTLAMDVEFKDVTLIPESISKAINVKGFELVLDNVVGQYNMLYNGEVMKTNSSLGKLDGGGKDSTVIIKNCSQLWFLGDFVNVTNYIQDTKYVFVNKTVSITNFTFEVYDGELEGGCQFDTEYGKVTITNITNNSSEGEPNRINYGADKNKIPYLTIKGEITNNGPELLLDPHYAINRLANGSNISLANASKIVTLEKDTPDKLAFEIKDAQEPTLSHDYDSNDVVWANMGVYLMPEGFESLLLRDKTNSEDINCLDYTQAVNYINTVANVVGEYEVELGLTDTNGIQQSDVNLTDGKAAGKSSITMPGKDKASSFTIKGDEYLGSNLCFAGNIATYGNVTFENLWLCNDNADSMTITHKKNSEGMPTLTLNNTVTDARAGISKIAGDKNLTVLNISLTNSMFPSVEDYGTIFDMDIVNLSGTVNEEYSSSCRVSGMSAVNNVYVNNVTFANRGSATFDTYHQGENATWLVQAKASVNSIEVLPDENSSSIQVVKQATPYLTVNDSVTGEVKVMVVEDGESGLEEIADYTNQPILISKAVPAELFMAGKDMETYKAYKDTKNYVYCGDVSKMDVKLVSNENETYVKTYADAITLINNASDAEADYTIILLNNEYNGGWIKTAVNKSGEPVYGALALPKAGKAASLTIKSQEDANPKLTLDYSGSITANCDLTFENVSLCEVKLDKKGNYDSPCDYITVALGNYKVTLGDGVETQHNITLLEDNIGTDTEMYHNANDYDLTINKITTGKNGTLDISGHNAYVIGNAEVGNLDVSVPATLAAKGKITATNVNFTDSAAENTELSLISKGAITLTDINTSANVDTRVTVNTAYTNKAWQKAATQFSFKGNMDSGVRLYINQFSYQQADPEMEEDVTGYKPVTEEQMYDILWHGYGKPAAWQKIVTAPKLQATEANVIFGNDEYAGYIPVKCDGGLYFTNMPMMIEVSGWGPLEGDPTDENRSYNAYFLTWEQAVKEIDTINNPNWEYVITLHEDLGSFGEPLSSLPMPAKAAKVTIVGGSDEYWTGEWDEETGEPIGENGEWVEDIYNVEGIATTATTITAKCDVDIQVPIVALKKSGNNYYPTVFTLSISKGENEVSLSGIQNGVDIDGFGWLEPQFKVSGTADSTLNVKPGFFADDMEEGLYTSMITNISKVGTVYLMQNPNATFEGAEGPLTKTCGFGIANGISGVNELNLGEGVVVESQKADVSVKNLTMGAPYYEEYEGEDGAIESVYDPYRNNMYTSGLQAKNLTVSGNLDMASAWITTGTSKSGDGKVTLNNVYFRDNCNRIEGKQDSKANSLIQVKGTVDAAEYMRHGDSAVEIGLFYHNTAQRYAQLTEGMTLLTAPKAEPSWFRPAYSWYDEESDYGEQKMGSEVLVEISKYDENGICVECVDENGTPDTTEDGKAISIMELASIYGLYKSGNTVKYGQTGYPVEATDVYFHNDTEYPVDVIVLKQTAEATVYIGTDNMDEPGAWDLTRIDYMTFEEAVKGIDGLNNENEKYCIVLNKDVEIGNAKGDYKFSTLTLPSKAASVSIWGNDNSLYFGGNLTLRCNTAFTGVNLVPVKVVNKLPAPATVNVSVGNNTMTWKWSTVGVVELVENSLEWHWDEHFGFGNVTGSNKSGTLIIEADSFFKANNITGFNAVVFKGTGNYRYFDEHGNEATPETGELAFGTILTDGNLTTKEIVYSNKTAANLHIGGNLTTDIFKMDGENIAEVQKSVNKIMKVNGRTLSEKIDGVTVKTNVSVIYTGFENPEDFADVKINVLTVSTDAPILPGTKVITGKYLNVEDWNLTSLSSWDEEGNPDIVNRNIYKSGEDIYMGAEVQ